MKLIFTLLPFLCSVAGFLYGAVRYFRPKGVLFHQLVVCALGCMMLGRMHGVVMMLSSGEIPRPFHVGLLGVFGGFLFLLTASYGQMDGLVDGRQPELIKYRVIALIAPVLIIAIGFPVLLRGGAFIPFLVLLPAIASSYYNLKHSIIPDVEFGILESIRGYNRMALVLALLYAGELMTDALEIRGVWYVITGMLSVAYLAVIPVLERGSRKWTL